MTRSSLIALAISVMALSTACSNLQKKPDAAPKPVVSNSAEAKPAEALVKKSPLESELVCVQGNDRRTIVISRKSPGCDVHYSKFNESHHVANAINTPSICTDVQAKIRNNLEAGQFACKADDSSRKTASAAK